MIRINGLHLPLDYDEIFLSCMAADILHIKPENIRTIQMYKRSTVIKNKADIHFSGTVDVTIHGEESALVWGNRDKRVSLEVENDYKCSPVKSVKPRPVVVGMGPAGLFAALILAQAGACPIVLERGSDVTQRTADVLKFWETGILDPDSNVQFGEGGAGAFSDGKLKTGSKNPLKIKILKELVKAGAPEEILYLEKPHIGTDRLKMVVGSIRNEIIKLGGEIRFQSVLTGLIHKEGRICGITYEDHSAKIKNNGLPNEKTEKIINYYQNEQINIENAGHGTASSHLKKGKSINNSFKEGLRVNSKFEESIKMELTTSHVILAIGHSARDTFEKLFVSGVPMEQKPFAIGVRIEHPQQWIDRIQYGEFAGSKELGAADYKMVVHLPNGKSVYTFCMCPGGSVIAATSEHNGIVTNGMSYYERNGVNSNTALLVTVDRCSFENSHPLSGMYFQRKMEQNAFQVTGNGYNAPVQKLEDFMKKRNSCGFGDVLPSYQPGTTFVEMDSLLPADITDSMRLAILGMEEWMPGFAYPDAILTGVETRSSSAVRILRGESLEAVGWTGLYPCGEGAGYAGGILSAAVDGICCAERVLEKI